MYNESFDPNAQEKASLKYEVYDWVESAVFAVVCMIIALTFIGRIISVDGASMEPTLQDKDRLISSRMFYTPKYGDIVIVTKPNEKNDPLIKRVIATEGEEVSIDFEAGVVYIDGQALVEPYTAALTTAQYDVQFPVIVPENHVFIMGDNRNNSWDSRDSGVGMIDEKYILGRVVIRLMPFDKFGFLERPKKD